MADELIDGMTVEEFEAWYLRIFGSVEAYTASLPSRNWVRGPNGWVSYPND